MIWKDIPGYEGLYQVSSDGKVKGLERYVAHWRGGLRKYEEKELSQSIEKVGYRCVVLCKEGKMRTHRVHSLIAMAFFNHQPCGYNILVDHINNNKLDNRLKNIQLVDCRTNSSKDRKVGLSGFRGVSKTKTGRYKSKIIDKKVTYNLGTFDTAEEAHNAYVNKLSELQHI
jgi:hypothetical protein